MTVNGNIATVSGNSWSCNISLATNQTHTLNIKATDMAGNETNIVRYIRVVPKYLLYESGTSYVNFTTSIYGGSGGTINYNSDHIYVASNPDAVYGLQPYAILFTPVLSGYNYKYVNVTYDSWSQSDTTSASKFAVLNDTSIEQGSTNRSFANKVVSKSFSSASGTVQIAWTDGKIIGLGCFSQSNRSCVMKIRKIWFSS